MKPHILVVDDDNGHRKLYVETLRQSGFDPTEAIDGDDALQEIRRRPPQLVVSDVCMPGLDGLSLLHEARKAGFDCPFLLVTAHADIRGAVHALKLGAVDYLEKPIDLDELITAVSDALGTPAPKAEVTGLPPQAMQNIIAESPIMQHLFRDSYRVAQSDANILILGESGVGKEVVAQFIHRNSPRHDHPLIPVNCAAIPASLLASELFGHEKGAFTGATGKRAGHFREAHGGTLFLDEIGDMPLELQPALLRALESGKIKPVGSDREITVDVRLIAATNHNLFQRVQEGAFREDLYYRLNVIAFKLPSLAERPEDILPLARCYLPAGKRLSPATARCLQNYNWPGNVRELSNAMQRAGILSNAEIILPEHLPPDLTLSQNHTQPRTANPAHQEIKTVECAEIEAIQSALTRTSGNRTRAAELLGISRRALLYKIKRYQIT